MKKNYNFFLKPFKNVMKTAIQVLIISVVHVALVFTRTVSVLLLFCGFFFLSTAVQFYDPQMTYLHFDWLVVWFFVFFCSGILKTFAFLMSFP